jgi:hypothetical protein
VKGYSIYGRYTEKIYAEEITKNPKIVGELNHSALRNAWKMILEGRDWENPDERLKFIRKCVKELNIDMMEDKDFKGNQSLSILMESHRCRKKGEPI